MFRWTVVEEVPANGLDVFGKIVRRKCTGAIGILRNVGRSSDSS